MPRRCHGLHLVGRGGQPRDGRVTGIDTTQGFIELVPGGVAVVALGTHPKPPDSTSLCGAYS